MHAAKLARLLLLLSLAGAAAACSPPPRQPSPARAMVRDGALLVDVRTPREFAAGHLEGALNIPLQELAERMAEVGPRERPVVVYCQTGSRSEVATELLRQAGYQTVYDLGRMRAW